MENDGKVNILVVDDMPEKVLALQAVLDDLGQNIVRANSGREALRCLLQQEFAVILLDVNMPGMDGFETASLIRQRKSTQDVPIIFVTAYGDDMHAVRGYSLGAVDYIQTPVVADVLRTKVSVFVELFRKTAQVRRQAAWLRRRASQMQKLAAASIAIHGEPSMEKMLQVIADSAREIVGAHQAVGVFLTNQGASSSASRTLAVASFSDKYTDWRGRPLDLDAVATTIMAQSASSTRMTAAELRDHPDWEILGQANVPPIARGILAAPLHGRDGSGYGVIYLSDRLEDDFSGDDEAVLVQLAHMASIAIENSLFAQEREANRLKDQFLWTLSHELRTPLNAILGWTKLLRLEDLPTDTCHGLEVIERNAQAQVKLIEDLLDVSRITTGKLRLNVRPVSFSSVIQAAVDTILPAAEAKRIQVSCTLLDSDQLQGDPDRLQQVVWNVLSNAVKFTPPGGRVQLTLERVGSQLQLCISDTGKGIDVGFLPYVFDRFRQADSSSTRSHGGLGLGLTIARHIIELHGGTITAYSPGEGLGSRFVITLRSADAAPQPGEAHDPASQTMSAEGLPDTRSLAGIRVLLVDDDPDGREFLCEMLSRLRMHVTAVASAREALDALVTTQPQILISDLAMPEQDGYSLVQTLRTLPPERGGQIPAIAVTAYAREADRQRALAAGFGHHVAKPVVPEVLAAAILKLVPKGAFQNA